MPLYKKESLEELRQRIDLAEVVGSYVQLKRAGASYKALCPFHEEKTPSFVIQKGDSHYHCFGCGAHGDAIAFLMGHVKMGFTESVEMLAERFGVALEQEETRTKEGPSKGQIKEALERASQFYHFALLHTEEGQEALRYLYDRGLDLDFIQFFEVGYAPRDRTAFRSVMHAQNISDAALEEAGLILKTEQGRVRDFFFQRITFPIRDATGAVIGFSARKFKEETGGGKYINTSETSLFKKSRVLFGLSYSRKRIAKERKAIIVEGQIDALKLIASGFDMTVAGLGTAFGEQHVQELVQLGVTQVYLAMDGDNAGREATVKIGLLFQKRGVEVLVLKLPEGQDPDTLLREEGPHHFAKLLQAPGEFLPFWIDHLSKRYDIHSAAGKNSLVQEIAAAVRTWDHPVHVHETLKKLAFLTDLPENAIGIEPTTDIPLRKTGHITPWGIDPHRVLETDLLRWLLLAGDTVPRVLQIARLNLQENHFRIDICRRLYSHILAQGTSCDLLALGAVFDKPEEQTFLSDIVQKKVNLQKAEEGMIETVRKILQREWMEQREAIKLQLHTGKLEEDQALELARQFDALKKQLPEVALP